MNSPCPVANPRRDRAGANRLPAPVVLLSLSRLTLTQSPMKTAPFVFVVALCASSFPVIGAAQVAPAAQPARPATAATDEAIQLNVFEVSADKDDSYGALNSNSIT